MIPEKIRNTHPELGWSYHAALVCARNDVSMGEVLKAAAADEELQRESWAFILKGILLRKYVFPPKIKMMTWKLHHE